MKKEVILSLLIMVLISPAYLHAHGVVYEISNARAVLVKVGYDDGEPMSYTEIKIYAPTDQKIEYQNGRTDKNGCFMFLPDQTGEWKISVGDEMGHAVTETFIVNEAMETEEMTFGLPRWYKLVVGICVLWGMAGFYMYYSSRKNPKNNCPQ